MNEGTKFDAALDKVLEEDSNFVDKLIRLTEYTFNNMKNDQIFAYRYYFFVSRIFEKAEKNIIYNIMFFKFIFAYRLFSN